MPAPGRTNPLRNPGVSDDPVADPSGDLIGGRNVGRRPRLGVDARVIDDRYHGIGRSTFEVLQQLAELDLFDITLFTSAHQQSTRLDLGALVNSGAFSVASFDEQLTSVAQQWRWPRALKRANIEIALFPYHLGAPIFGARKRFTLIHDCIFEADPRFAPDTRTRMMYRLLTWFVSHRSTVLTPSRASADEIQRYYRVPMPDWRVVSWGVDAPQEPTADGGGPSPSPIPTPTPSPTPSLEAGQRAGAAALPPKYYLHVGADRPHKNLGLLVRVLAQLDADEHLVLVGSQDARWPSEVEALASSLGVADRVIRLSDISDDELFRAYQGARAFLYPSLIEGFGLPLLESMASGVPVIASDIPVFREVAEEAALLVAPHDVAEWCVAIRRLDDDALRTKLVERGRKVAANATWERAGAALAGALNHS